MEHEQGVVGDDEWIGTKLLFQNEVVRVWDFNLPPGQSTKLHTHKRDWLFVDVTDKNMLRIDYPDRPEPDHRSREDGQVTFSFVDKVDPDRRTHRATNSGGEPLRQILIEFMTTGIAAKAV